MKFKSMSASFKTPDVQAAFKNDHWSIRVLMQVGQWVYHLTALALLVGASTPVH